MSQTIELRSSSRVKPAGCRGSVLRAGKLCTAVLALPLLLASAGAGAAWPWQSQSGFNAAWCKGFVAAGLASKQVQQKDRTALWLAWNYTIRQGAAGQLQDVATYQQGAASFGADMTAGQVQNVLDQASGQCGLGRSGFQVTGW